MTIYEIDDLRAAAAAMNLSGYLSRILKGTVPVDGPVYRKAAGPTRSDPSSWHVAADGMIERALSQGWLVEVGEDSTP